MVSALHRHNNNFWPLLRPSTRNKLLLNAVVSQHSTQTNLISKEDAMGVFLNYSIDRCPRDKMWQVSSFAWNST